MPVNDTDKPSAIKQNFDTEDPKEISSSSSPFNIVNPTSHMDALPDANLRRIREETLGTGRNLLSGISSSVPCPLPYPPKEICSNFSFLRPRQSQYFDLNYCRSLEGDSNNTNFSLSSQSSGFLSFGSTISFGGLTGGLQSVRKINERIIGNPNYKIIQVQHADHSSHIYQWMMCRSLLPHLWMIDVQVTPQSSHICEWLMSKSSIPSPTSVNDWCLNHPSHLPHLWMIDV